MCWSRVPLACPGGEPNEWILDTEEPAPDLLRSIVVELLKKLEAGFSLLAGEVFLVPCVCDACEAVKRRCL